MDASPRAAWMAAAQEGDRAAYERLLADILPALRAFTRRRLGDDTAAVEDVVQEVLLSVHRSRRTYRPERPFEPWLFAIARNAVADFQRTRARRRGREESLPEDDFLQDGSTPSPSLPGADGAERPGELSPALDAALAKLPRAQREAVVMLHLEGLSVVEAALRAKVSAGALRVRAHRGYRALRGLLGRPSP
jgi:RNA polymerase sigma-70 factor (ECF subfamily)